MAAGEAGKDGTDDKKGDEAEEERGKASTDEGDDKDEDGDAEEEEEEEEREGIVETAPAAGETKEEDEEEKQLTGQPHLDGWKERRVSERDREIARKERENKV